MKAKLTVEVITSGPSTSRVAIAGAELKVPTDLLEIQFAEEPTACTNSVIALMSELFITSCEFCACLRFID